MIASAQMLTHMLLQAGHSTLSGFVRFARRQESDNAISVLDGFPVAREGFVVAPDIRDPDLYAKKCFHAARPGLFLLSAKYAADARTRAKEHQGIWMHAFGEQSPISATNDGATFGMLPPAGAPTSTRQFDYDGLSPGSAYVDHRGIPGVRHPSGPSGYPPTHERVTGTSRVGGYEQPPLRPEWHGHRAHSPEDVSWQHRGHPFEEQSWPARGSEEAAWAPLSGFPPAAVPPTDHGIASPYNFKPHPPQHLVYPVSAGAYGQTPVPAPSFGRFGYNPDPMEQLAAATATLSVSSREGAVPSKVRYGGVDLYRTFSNHMGAMSSTYLPQSGSLGMQTHSGAASSRMMPPMHPIKPSSSHFIGVAPSDSARSTLDDPTARTGRSSMQSTSRTAISLVSYDDLVGSNGSESYQTEGSPRELGGMHLQITPRLSEVIGLEASTFRPGKNVHQADSGCVNDDAVVQALALHLDPIVGAQ
jgi:hypothetical protein